MEEGYRNYQPVNEAPAKKKKGVFHCIRGKRKYIRNAQTGSEKKTSSVVRAPGNDESIIKRTPTPCPSYDAKKITKAHLAKRLRYKCWDKIKSAKKSKRLEHQLLNINEQNENELALTEAKLAAKVVECNEVATMAQARRSGESKAMKMADNKIATMKDEMNKKIGAAKCEVQAASADARTTVLSERSYTSLITNRR